MCRLHRSAAAVAFVIAIAAPALQAAAAGTSNITTRECLTKAGSTLKGAWEKYPLDSQKVTREQIFTDTQTMFNQDVRACQPPKGTTLQKAIDYYIDCLQDIYTLFPAEKMKTERSAYMRFAGLTFKREAECATDYASPRTTQDAYQMLFKQVSQLSETLVQEKYKEVRTDGISNLNALFGQLLTSAKIPEKGDPPAMMAANIKEARIKFPLTTKLTEERNKAIVTVLENAAKRAQQREVQKR